MATHVNFEAQLFSQNSTGGWHFLALPEALSLQIREVYQSSEEGWGRLKVKACVGGLSWDTAIWFDSKRKCYLLPIKAEIRKKQKIAVGDSLKCDIWVG